MMLIIETQNTEGDNFRDI